MLQCHYMAALLTDGQKKLYGDKLIDLAHLIFGGMVIGQFITDRPIDPLPMSLGALTSLSLYISSYTLTKNQKVRWSMSQVDINIIILLVGAIVFFGLFTYIGTRDNKHSKKWLSYVSLLPGMEVYVQPAVAKAMADEGEQYLLNFVKTCTVWYGFIYLSKVFPC